MAKLFNLLTAKTPSSKILSKIFRTEAKKRISLMYNLVAPLNQTNRQDK